MKTLLTVFLSVLLTAGYAQTSLNGAWIFQPPAPSDTAVVLLIEDNYFSVTHYTDKSFIGTFGGTAIAQNGKMTGTYEFSSIDPGMIGQPSDVTYELNGDNLTVTLPDNTVLRWKRAPVRPTTSVEPGGLQAG